MSTHDFGRDTIQSTEVAWPCDGTIHGHGNKGSTERILKTLC